MTNNVYIVFLTIFIIALPFVLPLVILKLFKEDSNKGSSFYNLNRKVGSRQIPKVPEVLPTPPLPTYQEYIRERSFGREFPQNAQPEQADPSSEASDDDIKDNTYEINNDIYTIESDEPEISTAEDTNPEFPETPPVPKKKKLDMTVSTILFLIGTAFVALSGIAFGVASWVRTSHEGKVAIIAAAAATAFVISYIFSKALKLSGSSISFYILGSGFTATAFVTAGYYKLMGEWLSFGGGGSLMLIASSFALAAFLTLLGNKFYDKLPLFYTSLSAAALSIFFAVLQVFDTLRESAPAFIVLQAFITAAVSFGNFGKGTKYELPIKRIGIGASIFYGGFAVSYTINRIISPDFTSYFCMIAIIVQLLFYGIKNKKSSLISVEAVLSIVLSAMISNSITETAPDRYFVISFSILVMLVYAMHRFIPAMNNTFTELLTLFVTLVNSFACITNAAPGKFVPELVICGIISVILTSYVFHKNNGIQFTAGIISPIIPAMIAWNASYSIKGTYHIKDIAALNSICWGILTLILIGVTAALIYLPKHDFNKGFLADGILHANMIASGIILIAVPEYSAMIFIPLAMCLLHFAVSGKMKCNYTAVLSAVAFIKIWEAVASEHFGDNELLYDLVMQKMLKKSVEECSRIVREADTKIASAALSISSGKYHRTLIPFDIGSFLLLHVISYRMRRLHKEEHKIRNSIISSHRSNCPHSICIPHTSIPCS